MSLTGKQPTPKITEQCATDYRMGLNTAFHDEQETVDFYHRIAAKTDVPYIKETFSSAAADEQNHAVWYLYFMNL